MVKNILKRELLSGFKFNGFLNRILEFELLKDNPVYI